MNCRRGKGLLQFNDLKPKISRRRLKSEGALMVVVRKKSKEDSREELIKAIKDFAQLLETEGESDAVNELDEIQNNLRMADPESDGFKKAIKALKECFEGDHELISYTMRKSKDGEWSNADLLYLASTKVLGIMRRFGS